MAVFRLAFPFIDRKPLPRLYRYIGLGIQYHAALLGKGEQHATVFLTRVRAVAYLLRLSRATPDGIDELRGDEADVRLQELDMLDRLLSDVRAGPVGEFRLHKPNAIEVVVID